MKTLVLFIVSIFVLNMPSFGQDLETVLKNHYEALGGQDKIRNLKTLQISQTLHTQNIDILQKTYIDIGNALKTETNAMGQVAVVCVKGDEGWQINPAQFGHSQPVNLEESLVKRLKSQPNALSPLLEYESNGYSLSLEGEESVNKEVCYKLNMTKGSSAIMLYISKKDFNIKLSKTKSTETYFYDYKKINGYSFPMEVETITPNGKVTIIDREILVNTGFEESLFIAGVTQ